jgi:hypothetical protein
MKILIAVLFCFSSLASSIPQAKVDRLIRLLKFDKKWEGIIVQTVKMDMVNNPELKLVEKEWIQHFKKYKNWNDSKAGIYSFYSKHFTESDIDQLIKMYESPVMEKFQKFSPLLTLEIRKVFRNQSKEEKASMAKLLKKVQDKLVSQKKAAQKPKAKAKK